MELGKIPPHDIEAEQAVIGSMLTDQDAVMTAVERLKSDSFYREDNKLIFEAIVNLYNRSEPIDLITVKDDKRVNLKEFKKSNQTRPLSFASENELINILGLNAGSVTPLGILNNNKKTVKVFLDKAFFEPPEIIGVHPNDNTATVWLKTNDLVEIIKEHGNEVSIAEI